jgi:hypothetical protein
MLYANFTNACYPVAPALKSFIDKSVTLDPEVFKLLSNILKSKFPVEALKALFKWNYNSFAASEAACKSVYSLSVPLAVPV